MQLFVKHENAWPVMASGRWSRDNPEMPPIKRQPRARQRTFFREWREFRELKQYEAAERIKVDPSTLSRLESGQSPYDQDILEKMALAYGCAPGDLLRVDPRQADGLVRLFDTLSAANPDLQRQAAAILDALLKPPR